MYGVYGVCYCSVILVSVVTGTITDRTYQYNLVKNRTLLVNKRSCDLYSKESVSSKLECAVVCFDDTECLNYQHKDEERTCIFCLSKENESGVQGLIPDNRTLDGPVWEKADVDDCVLSPCYNGATCVDLKYYYTCVCLPGYTGILCQTYTGYWMMGGKVITQDYDTLLTQIIEKNHNTSIYETSKNILRNAVIDGDIWLCYTGENYIDILTIHGVFINRTEFTANPTGMVQMNDGQIVVATDSGMFVMQASGTFLKILSGRFTDISGNMDNYVAMYEYLGNTLNIYRYINNTFSQLKTISQLRFHKSESNSVAVSSDRVYLALIVANSVRVYSLMGSLVQTVGKYGSSATPGDLINPIMCGSSTTGYALVCDSGDNHRLQVVSTDGEWKIYKFAGNVEQPHQALIDLYGNVYLGWRSSVTSKFYITRYKQ